MSTEHETTTSNPLHRPPHIPPEGSGSTLPVPLDEIKKLDDLEHKADPVRQDEERRREVAGNTGPD